MTVFFFPGRVDALRQRGCPSCPRGFFISLAGRRTVGCEDSMTESEQVETASPVSGEGQLPFRYDARLANEIEARWQARWAADGTFNCPNPVGSLADGFERM